MATKSTNGGDVEVTLKNVRLSFAHIFTAQVKEQDDGSKTKKFNCSFLIPEDTKQGKLNIAAMEDAIEEAKEKKWGDNIPKLKSEKLCLRDGNNEDWDGYEGHMYVSASNTKRPAIIDRDKTPLSEEDGRPYSGCYVNAVVRVWAMDNKHGKRVNASLEAIQFVKDGDPFSGFTPVDVDSKFEDLGDDEDEAPRKKKPASRRDDDEDEAPRKKKPVSRRDDDEDEDDAPRRKKPSRRDEDDEEDERPARRRRPRDEDDED